VAEGIPEKVWLRGFRGRERRELFRVGDRSVRREGSRGRREETCGTFMQSVPGLLNTKWGNGVKSSSLIAFPSGWQINESGVKEVEGTAER